MGTDLEKAGIFLNRAAELRGISENVKDPDTKDALIKWAETYEAIADRIIEARSSEKADPQNQISK